MQETNRKQLELFHYILKSLKVRLIRLFIGLTLITCIDQCHTDTSPEIKVIVSSREGDRLTEKKDINFMHEKKSPVPVIEVNDSIHYQHIAGFGATFNEAGMICLNSLSKEKQDSVFRSLFDSVSGAGFSMMKAPMASCDFASAGPWYSYDDVPGDTLMKHFSIDRDAGPDGMVNYIKNASQFGKFGIESTMDFAPDWMMYSLKQGEKHVKPEYYNALARYYADYIETYASHGIQINFLNPFNEPENSWYSNVTYNEIGELIKHYIIPRFKEDGIRAKIQLCESSTRQEALQKFPVVLDDTTVARYISTLTVHGYDWNKFSTLTDLHLKYPDYPIWMTEVCYARVNDQPTNEPPGGPDSLPVYSFDDGEFWGNMIMNDLNHYVSAWVYWNMILDENGGPWLISPEHGDPDNNRQHPVVVVNRVTGKISYTGLYFYLAQFSRYIRPGAYRIQCKGNIPQLNYSGFINQDKSIILVVINNGPEMRCGIQWRKKLAGLEFKPHSITTLIWH